MLAVSSSMQCQVAIPSVTWNVSKYKYQFVAIVKAPLLRHPAHASFKTIWMEYRRPIVGRIYLNPNLYLRCKHDCRRTHGWLHLHTSIVSKLVNAARRVGLTNQTTFQAPEL